MNCDGVSRLVSRTMFVSLGLESFRSRDFEYCKEMVYQNFYNSKIYCWLYLQESCNQNMSEKCQNFEKIQVRSMGDRRNFSRVGKLDILLILSMLLTIHTMSVHVHKTLCPFYTITKIPPATRGRDEGGRGGAQFPGHRITMEAP